MAPVKRLEMGEDSTERIRKPLIEGNTSSFDDSHVNKPADKAGKRSRWNQSMIVYISTLVALCGSYEIGAMKGYSSPVEFAIMEELGLTTTEYSIFGSILNIGAMVGAITSGTIADLVGRKWAMSIFNGFCILGWLTIYFAQGVVALGIGRLAGGYGVGAFFYVVPVYIAEITPTHSRGVLTAFHQVLLCIGLAATFMLGIVLPWRSLALAGVIPCALQILGLPFVSESPRWHAKRGATKEFLDSLQKLRGKDADISQEASEIQNFIEDLQGPPQKKLYDLFHGRYLRSMTVISFLLLRIGVGLMAVQEFGGISGITFYTNEIFESAGISSTLGTILYASIQIVINVISSALVDEAGRKPLLLVAAAGLTAGCLITATSFFLKAHDLWIGAVPILALTGIMVYIISYSAGMGGVPFVITSEIFPMNIKGFAGSVAASVNWFFAWAVSYTFSFLMSWSSYGTFLLFAAINALAMIFVVKVVPETKGRSLEQIQAEINS